MANWHVEPVNDLIPHNTNDTFCKCKPKIKMQENGNLIIMHHSYDGREELQKKRKES